MKHLNQLVRVSGCMGFPFYVTKTWHDSFHKKLAGFQEKLLSLTFLDIACGSGNFLTETYLSLRRLENRAVRLRLGDQMILGDSADFNPIQVGIGQFYRIEINDFAVTVVPKDKLNYIMGNPPFVGSSIMAQGSEKKQDVPNAA